MRQAPYLPSKMRQIVSLGLATALLSLPNLILSTSVAAQQLPATTSQDKNRAATKSSSALSAPTKSLEKKDQQISRKSHSLILRPQTAPLASIQPSAPAGTTSPQPAETPISQTQESPTLGKNTGSGIPSSNMSFAGSPIATTGAPTSTSGTKSLAAANPGSAVSAAGTSPTGRSMGRLAAEMPKLTQVIAPIPAPAISSSPVIGISPSSLSFTAQQGSGNPATQALTISNTGGGTLNWSASDSMAWLSLSPASGTGTGTMTVSVTTGSLAAGSYTGTVSVSATGASTITIPITFTVTAAPAPPAISASPTSFSFTAQTGVNPATQTLTISNSGSGTLAWSASDNAAWLTLSPTSGTGNSTVTLTVTTGALTAGTYSGQITVTATGTTAVLIPVTFTVTAAPVPPAIGVSPTSLSFSSQQGGSNPTAQTLNISNAGGGTLSWNASPTTTWLTVSPTSGTGNLGITVSAITGILTTGTYNGSVTVSASGASSVTIPVTFTVTAPPSITLSPTSLTFTATQGGANPTSQNITLTNTGGAVSWTVSDNAAWLSVTPVSGSGSSTLTATVNTTGLTAATYTGTITVTPSGSSSRTVAVTLTVSAPTTSSVTLAWTPNTDSDLAGYKVYRRTASGTYGTPIATLPSTTTTYMATGLLSQTTYFFVITAFDSSGNESSPSTPEASITIP